MRSNLLFIFFLAVLSIISGFLLSRMSWIGRVGINLMHKEYKFLKVWYKGAGVVFVVWMLLFLLQSMVQKKLSLASSRMVHIAAIIIAIAGLYITYKDFRTDFSHGLLKERFHLGAYLFWIGWMSISLFFLTKPTAVAVPDKQAPLV